MKEKPKFQEADKTDLTIGIISMPNDYLTLSRECVDGVWGLSIETKIECHFIIVNGKRVEL